MGGIGLVVVSESKRSMRDEFLKKVREQWRLLWRERFDDRFRGEGVAVRDYPLVFMDRGFVVFASRDAKVPSFSEILEYWAFEGLVYAPDPAVGGWGKFVRTHILRRSRRRKNEKLAKPLKGKKQQLKKGGRGWLHIE